MTVQSVERALNILEELSLAKDTSKGIGVLELSRIMRLKSSTVHNLLKTLVHRGYVEQIKGTSKYYLGFSCYDLVSEKLITNRLAKASEADIFNLNQRINESIVLVTYYQGERFIILEVEGQQHLKVNKYFYLTVGAYGTATGRILLSQLSDEELKNYIKRHGFPDKGWDEINDFESLKKELIEIKKKGMVAHQAGHNQIQALAVPITGRKEKLVAALGVYLPLVRFKGKHKKEIIKGLKDTAKKISAKFSS